jgi:hypothetical protein
MVWSSAATARRDGQCKATWATLAASAASVLRPPPTLSSRPGGQGGRHVQDLLAGGGQLLGDGPSQPEGALNGEPPGQPPSRPGRQLLERAGMHQQPAVAQRRARRVDGDGGE